MLSATLNGRASRTVDEFLDSIPPPDPPPSAALPALLRAGIEHLLDDILANLPPGAPPAVFVRTRGGVKVTLHLGPVAPAAAPTDPHGRPLTRCQQDVLRVARDACTRFGRKVLGAEIRTAVVAAGLKWGTSSINTALADLVAAGMLFNAHDKTGYAPADSEFAE
jgi:hypothetical protein